MANYKHYIGETFTAFNGMKFTIIDIDRTLKKPFTIQFENGYTTNIKGGYLKDGAYIKNANLANIQRIDRIGEQNRHQDGRLMTIIEYNNSNDILVKFDDSSIVKSTYKRFVNGTCTYNRNKIKIFNVDYDSVGDACKHFRISQNTFTGKSSTEIEEYITNNRIEYNGQWMDLDNYVRTHGVVPVNYYKYLRSNNIEKNATNVKRYITYYLETNKDKIDAIENRKIKLKIINDNLGTSFKSFANIITSLGLSDKGFYENISDSDALIKYIRQHCISYKGQWISIKSYCEKLGIDYNSLTTWAKTRRISINAKNIMDTIENYSNDMSLGSKKERVYEMQKLEQLIKRYIIPATCNIRVRLDNIYKYFNNNNLSAEQVIVHFRPDLHINIFGKIVDENGNEV